MEMTADLKTVTLTMRRQNADGFASYATLRRSESSATGIIEDVPKPLASDPCQTCVEKLTGVGGESCLDCHLKKQ